MSAQEGVVVMVVEDEPLARRGVCRAVSGVRGIAQIVESASGPDAVEQIVRLQPDLVILDISLPGFDGFEVIRRVGAVMPPVVFLTAYDAYAIRAFEVSAVDYVLKPYALNRLQAAVQRALARRHDQDAIRAFQALALRGGAPRASSSFLRRIVATAGKRGVVIPVDDISWIEADDYCLRVHTPTLSATVRETLDAMTQQLDPAAFVRAHRTALVRLDAVQGLTRSERAMWLILKDGTQVPVARSRMRLVVQALEGRA